jgi:hypothetical protein
MEATMIQAIVNLFRWVFLPHELPADPLVRCNSCLNIKTGQYVETWEE